MDELNFRVVHVYGLTETYGPITMCPEQEEWRELPAVERATLLARQGQAYPSADLVRVVDDDMNDVPRDGDDDGRGRDARQQRDGRLLRRSRKRPPPPSAAAGSTPATSRSGTPTANVELRDRGKDIIISGGENISSIEVEQTIVAHPAVLECAVVGVPHPHWGERPKAFVTLKDGAGASAGEIIAFARERLAHYKCPDAIEFGPLPKTSTGKVQKYVLRERGVGRAQDARRRRVEE